MTEKQTKEDKTEPASKQRSHSHESRRIKFIKRSIDQELDKYPISIVWSPLPILTWFIPFIGHTGITDSNGIIYDFSDDFNVSVDNFSFGSPTKVFFFSQRDIPQGAESWDTAIKAVSDHYNRTRHSLCFNNCHIYIADVLNKVNYKNRTDWDQVEVWRQISFYSKYVGFVGFIRQWMPFTVILSLIMVIIIVLSQ